MNMKLYKQKNHYAVRAINVMVTHPYRQHQQVVTLHESEKQILLLLLLFFPRIMLIQQHSNFQRMNYRYSYRKYHTIIRTPIQQQQPYYYSTPIQQQQPYYYPTPIQQHQPYYHPTLPRVKLNHQNEYCCQKCEEHRRLKGRDNHHIHQIANDHFVWFNVLLIIIT